MARRPELCGKVLFSYAAIFSLHILGRLIAQPMPVDETAEFQKIIGAKRRSASRDVTEGILRRQIRHVAQKGLERAGPVVVEDSILAPVEFPRHQLVLGATQRMKGVRYSEPAWGVSQTTCIR